MDLVQELFVDPVLEQSNGFYFIFCSLLPPPLLIYACLNISLCSERHHKIWGNKEQKGLRKFYPWEARKESYLLIKFETEAISSTNEFFQAFATIKVSIFICYLFASLLGQQWCDGKELSSQKNLLPNSCWMITNCISSLHFSNFWGFI